MQRLRASIKQFLEQQRQLPWLKCQPDPRQRRGRRYAWLWVIQTLLTGLMTGKTTLRAIEYLSERYGKRISDTQLWRLLDRMKPEQLLTVLKAQVLQAWHSKSLRAESGMNQVAVDGKTIWSGKYEATKACHKQTSKGTVRWRVHVLNAALVSSAHPMLIDQMAVPGKKAESSTFPAFLESLVQVYGKISMLQLISADAGFTDHATASLINKRGIGYLLGLKGNQPTLLAEAKRLLETQSSPEVEDDWEQERHGMVKRQLFRSSEIAGFHDWKHLRQVLRVRRLIVDKKTQKERTEERYFLTNLCPGRATAKALLTMVRRHWLIENGLHWTLDTQFKEDEHPLSARSILPVALLRGIVYNILGLLRTKHLRSERNRSRSWQNLMDLVSDTLLLASQRTTANWLLAPLEITAQTL